MTNMMQARCDAGPRGRRVSRPIAALGAVLVAAVMAGCGGSDEDQHEFWKSQADSLRAQAEALASKTPCDRDSHCDGLRFESPLPSCQVQEEVAYSLLSPGARAAELLAAQQREAAERARRNTPGGGQVVCPAVILPVPSYHCTNSRCVQRIGTLQGALQP